MQESLADWHQPVIYRSDGTLGLPIPLTSKQWKELQAGVRSGRFSVEEARVVLVNRNLVLARWVAGLDEDYFQECQIALHKAASNYDFQQDIKFGTYATVAMRRHLKRIYKTVGGDVQHEKYARSYATIRRAKLTRSHVSLNRIGVSQSPLALEEINLLYKHIKSLPPIQRRVLHLIYWEGKTQAAMAAELGYSTKWAWYILGIITQKLRSLMGSDNALHQRRVPPTTQSSLNCSDRESAIHLVG